MQVPGADWGWEGKLECSLAGSSPTTRTADSVHGQCGMGCSWISSSVPLRTSLDLKIIVYLKMENNIKILFPSFPIIGTLIGSLSEDRIVDLPFI